MNKFLVKLEAKSSILTRIKGNILFGHVCWMKKFFYGEENLLEFLSNIESKKDFLIFSDAFPEGKLPVPIGLNKSLKKNLDDFRKVKKIKKIKFVDKNVFYRQTPLGEDVFLKEENVEKKEIVEKVITRSSTNRITNVVLEGALFSQNEKFYENLDLYVFTNYDLEYIRDLLTKTFFLGYGADKNVGKGNIKILDIISVNFEDKNTGCYMSLADFIPSKLSNLMNIKTDYITKYGKVYNNYVSNPFKKPIIMHKAGTTFCLEEKEDYIGSFLNGIHSDKRIKQTAFAPIISIKLKEDCI